MAKRMCSIGGCEKQHYARGWCQMHYKRWQKHGSPGTAERITSEVARSKSKRICKVDGCDRLVDSLDMCAMHYTRWRRHDDVERSASVGRPRSDGFVAYDSAHRRILTERGRADEHLCVRCGGAADDWAYTHDDPNELSGIRSMHGREYPAVWSADPKYYQPMCKTCHTQFDRERAIVS